MTVYHQALGSKPCCKAVCVWSGNIPFSCGHMSSSWPSVQATVSSHQFANGRAHTLTKKKKRRKISRPMCNESINYEVGWIEVCRIRDGRQSLRSSWEKLTEDRAYGVGRPTLNMPVQIRGTMKPQINNGHFFQKQLFNSDRLNIGSVKSITRYTSLWNDFCHNDLSNFFSSDLNIMQHNYTTRLFSKSIQLRYKFLASVTIPT